MTRAILMCLHKYTPFGGEFFEPILDFQLQQLFKYRNEFDRLYLVDSTWDIDLKARYLADVTVVKVNPSLRYYDAYKEVLPQIEEDLVLLMDNDMVVYRRGKIKETFDILEETYMTIFGGILPSYGVVSIVDQIGEYKTDRLKNGNKFCPYWFATRKELLMKYLDVDWGPDMPYCETLGHLTAKMLEDGVRPYEWEEDKTEATFENGEVKTEKNLGYYHIRAGSETAVLLAWKNSPEHQTQYQEYIKNQPKSEIIRHCNWYKFMGGNPSEILADL